MRRPDEALFVDMLLYARRVQKYMFGTSRDEFDANEILQFAVVHMLQVIGEAASRLTQEQRDKHHAVPWKEIIGMRHIIVHDYFRLDLDVVWDGATKSVPVLVAYLERAFPPPEE